MNKSLKVFQDSFSFILHFWGFKNVKINVFWLQNFSVHFYQIEVQVFSNWSRQMKKHQTFEI